MPVILRGMLPIIQPWGGRWLGDLLWFFVVFVVGVLHNSLRLGLLLVFGLGLGDIDDLFFLFF